MAQVVFGLGPDTFAMEIVECKIDVVRDFDKQVLCRRIESIQFLGRQQEHADNLAALV